MIVELTSTGVADTHALAAILAEVVGVGDLMVLAGELGAGKTAFVQGFAKALGYSGPVTSPTFTLVHTYAGRLMVQHLDVYRLERFSELHDLALPELLESKAVTLIEWGDAIASALPAEYLEVRLAYGGPDAPEEQRTITLRSVGARWAARLHELTPTLESFRC